MKKHKKVEWIRYNKKERREYLEKEYNELLDKKNKDDHDMLLLECFGRELGRMI